MDGSRHEKGKEGSRAMERRVYCKYSWDICLCKANELVDGYCTVVSVNACVASDQLPWLTQLLS